MHKVEVASFISSAVVVFCLGCSGSMAPPATPAQPGTPGVPAGLPAPVVDVTSVGAAADGVTDDTAAITKAFAQAQANGGGTVYFPAGRYLVGKSVTQGSGSSIPLASGPAITISGAGMNQSTIVETSPGADLLGIRADGTVVEDLGLDTRTNGAGHCIGVVANNTILERVHIVSGTRTFALYYAGPAGATPTAPSYNTGNQVLDSTIEDGVTDDGFSFSFQQNATIRNIVHTGSRLALYVDQNVNVTGYQYNPGTQTSARDGFYITPPAQNIVLQGFVSTGSGGIIGVNTTRVSSAITIDGEQMLNPGFNLHVGDVNGLTITKSTLAGTLTITPAVLATGVRVENSTLQAIIYSPQIGASVDQAAFTNDIYQPFAPLAATFVTSARGGTVSFTATGGQFLNHAGGFQSGPNTVYTQSVPGVP